LIYHLKTDAYKMQTAKLQSGQSVE